MKFRTKILLLLMGMLFLASLSVMLLTRKEVSKTINEIGHQEAITYLHLARMMIENEYKSIEFQKQYALNRYKVQLKNVTGIAVSNIDYFRQLHKKGILTEKQAKQFAAASVSRFRYENNDYFFIYNLDMINIAHADPSMVGKDLSGFRDLKGSYSLREMKKTVLEHGSGYLTFWYIRLGEKTPVEKLSYVTLYKDWGWIVGTGVYIDDIRRDEQMRLKSVLNELRGTFSRIRIEKTGYFYLFDGKMNMFIHPHMENMDMSDFKHPHTQRNHLKDLIDAASHPEKPFEYLWDKPGHAGEFRFWKSSYVTHFKPLDWYIATSVYQDEIELPARTINRKQAIFVVAVGIVVILIALLILAKVTGPLKRLSQCTDRFSGYGFSVLEEVEEETRRIGNRLKDEIGGLARSFGSMLASLKTHVEQLRQTTAQKEKIENELRIAHDIQMSMLPHPPCLIRKEYEIQAFLEPAREVGGDLFDFFEIDDGHLCLFIGDVSDKGIPAALFMSRSKTMIRMLVLNERTRTGNLLSPGYILEKANSELARDNTQMMFVTLFLCILDIESGQCTYASAGHNPPVLTTDRETAFLEKGRGIVLGVKEQASFEEKTISLGRNDILFLYTDGVTEAMNSRGECFSDERLLDILKNTALTTPQSVVETVYAQVVNHVEGCAHSDDIAILVLKYKGKENI